MKISIVTTVYNLEKYIKQCLDSIFSSTYKNIEVIVVNDYSSDTSMNIVNEYEDERMVIINHNENMGAGWARKHGIEVATGEYVITIDGDDWISEDFIEKLVENAKETDADIVSGGITIVKSDSYHEIKKFLPTISTGFKKFQDYGNDKIIFLNNKLVRRSMYNQVSYCTRRYCEDTPVILPLLYYANKVSYVDTQGYFYRQHSQSLCHSVKDFEQSLYKALCCKDMLKFFSDKGSEYQNLINRQEYLMYLKNVKEYGNQELFTKFKNELAELTPALLNMIFPYKQSEQKNNIDSMLNQRLQIAIHEAEKYGFKNNGRDNLVHVIWLGGAKFSDTILKCMESWKKYLGNRTLCLWTEKSLDMSHPWVKQTYALRKYAFATDYLRLWCVYFYGGIYLDVDVELIKDLEVNNNFFALESYTNSIALGLAFGAEKQNPVIASIASLYNKMQFNPQDCYKQIQPNLITDLFINNGWQYIDKEHIFKGFTIYPTEIFCPKNMQTGEVSLTDKTKAIHHYLGTWRN